MIDTTKVTSSTPADRHARSNVENLWQAFTNTRLRCRAKKDKVSAAGMLALINQNRERKDVNPQPRDHQVYDDSP